MEFDNNLRGLVKTCQEVIKAENNLSMFSSTQDNLIVKYLNKYDESFRLDPPLPLVKHKPFILELYRRFKDTILEKNTDFSWIENATLIIIFGDGDKHPSKNMRIMFSAFYRHALKLVERVENDLRDRPESERDSRIELNYPDALLMYLYRMFREVAPSEDKSALDAIVRHLETELGVIDGSHPDTVADPMAGMLAMAGSFMKKIGVALPPDAKMPNGADLGSALSSVLSNPKTLESINGIVKSVGGCKDPGQMFNVLGEQMRDGKLNDLLSQIQSVATTLQNVDLGPMGGQAGGSVNSSSGTSTSTTSSTGGSNVPRIKDTADELD
jgi:hypothetical protein